ncbi:hypothetical protein ACQVP2_14005 [Methylobacterium aquaticum]|jgi:hypothetical protein|uniref:Surface antigen n=1 Tax=Methylobacterium aquaticum TaxID=270351 RepID=A0A0J6VN37_9HYPH|nr:hypothetical protein [Methylobacterium aquaticum]KMO40591.1 hypothetical protein VP06_02545 [Methylobacterium aquaticum]
MTAPVTRAIAATALVASLLSAAPALAGGYGCTTDCYRHVSTPPVYGTVSEQVMVRPPRTVTHVVPPVYDTVSEQVLVEPARRVWQTSIDAYGQTVGCWVTIPARYATQTRRVLVRPAQVVPQVIPPAYASYQRRVLVEPARSGWVPAHGGGYAAGSGPGGIIGAGLGLAGAGIGIGTGLVFGGGSIYDGY